MNPNKKDNQRELAEKYKITQYTVSRLNTQGVDIYEKEEVRKAILSQAKRPKGWENGCPWDEPKEAKVLDFDLADLCRLDITSLRDEVAGCQNYDEARFIKTKISALKELMLLSIAMREHLPKSEVIDDIKVITSVISSALDKLPFDLPAVIEGLEASKMQGKIKAKVKEIKGQWHDLSSEIYTE